MNPPRRAMIRLGMGSSALLASGQTVPLFLAWSARAMAGNGASAKGRILGVEQLDGGNDGLNYRRPMPRRPILIWTALIRTAVSSRSTHT
jgi:uncharacterized protein (DUF1501 family)